MIDPRTLDLPMRSGVYLFKDERMRVLYVGKATDLRSRVRSYFTPNPDRAMVPFLIERAADVECIVTPSPSEALILERQLIRKHRPRFNSLLKDDKSYPFLAITNEPTPRILYTRHPPRDARRWGPFPRVGEAKTVVQLLRREFGIRDCKELLPQGCLSMHIGLCAGPCVDASGYDERVRAARQVLDGQATELLDGLVAEMSEASDAMRFEEAARTRDLIRAVRSTTSQHVVASNIYRDCDALGFATRGDLAAIVLLHADSGVVQGQETWPLIHRGDVGETVERFLSEHFSERRPPRLLLLPVPIGPTTEAWLSERRGSKVEARVPMRGDLATLRRLADQNAEVQLDRLERKQSGSLEQRAADEAATLLGVPRLDHVVCFDMAQLQGEARVGASVVLRHGRPLKREYRTYRVKDGAMDDLRMMREVVERWLKRQEEWPDLLLIDGGETHLTTIETLLDEHGLTDRIPLAALAKREETLHRTGVDPIILDRRGRVLVHARDEAHRFVNRFHRQQRNRTAMTDPLEQVIGLGAKKLQTLLRHFGGRQGVDEASIEDLRTVPGIGASLAHRIHEALHPSS